MSDMQLEVYKALREGQSKYTYFLLAGAGAAIGFSLTQTNGRALTVTQIPLGVAVALWGLSFLFGCLHLAYVNSALYSNAVLIQVQRGEHPKAGRHPDIIALASEGIRSGIESNADKANNYGHWQFGTLIAGAVAYIAWHVLECICVWVRTPLNRFYEGVVTA